MIFYKIGSTLEECSQEEALNNIPFVAVLNSLEWNDREDSFDMGIEMEMQLSSITATRAEVNYDSLTGSFYLPNRNDPSAPGEGFAFALDEKGIVFVDDGNAALSIIQRVKKTKKWKLPSLERFLYDFLEQIIHDDAYMLNRYELELNQLEDKLRETDSQEIILRLNEILGSIRDLRMHYEQLMDLGQELEENENSFFSADNLRYFHLFTARIAILRDTAASVRDYIVQLRDYYESQMGLKQNRIMTLLTVITSIFLPLTLITGWYGMNFKHMPELEWPWAYPALLGVFAVITIGCIIFFKKKKWM
ncbi:MAG: CorA family divalent cation transporter [Anaerovoracaceae bacterium]|nr:CorA family divalent cation transporter [Anaerovoracaceae bacterium]